MEGWHRKQSLWSMICQGTESPLIFDVCAVERKAEARFETRLVCFAMCCAGLSLSVKSRTLDPVDSEY
eukprot:2962229-Rhodomonas_salina.2